MSLPNWEKFLAFPEKGACAPDGAQGFWRRGHHSLDRLQQRQCELLLFLLSG